MRVKYSHNSTVGVATGVN